MIDKCTIRKASIKDKTTLIQFNKAMAIETENKILSSSIISSGVEKVLKNPDYGFYLVAEIENEICGSLMITKEWSDWRNGFFWWIQSVYIKPGCRRQGIYSKLYSMIKNIAKKKSNVCGFRLYAEKDNKIAQKTYSSVGMIVTPYIMYEELLI